MPEPRCFSKQELEKLDNTVLQAEELVNNFFKLSSGHWLKNRYDIKTAKDLDLHEQICGPFAQVVKYAARKNDAPLGSSAFSFYRVCLQDPAILSLVETNRAIQLAPFLLYILTHELIHIVRFLRFEHRYENVGEADLTLAEERKVHDLTHRVLSKVSLDGIQEVFDFYGQWRQDLEGGIPGKKKN